MELTYIGHSCFKIKTKDLTLVIDPYNPKDVGYSLPKMSADVVLTTHNHADHNFVEGVEDCKLVIDRPGEYEKADVFIYGISTFHDEKSGGDRGLNTIYLIEADGINILHLGDLGHELSDETLEKLSTVDVLLIPVGGTYTIDAEKATEIISEIEPAYVVPMHYKTSDLKGIEGLDPVEKFLDEMGKDKNVQKLDKLVLRTRSDIPEDTEVIILEPKH